MSNKVFNKRQCLKALRKIGFHKPVNQRRGNHDKYLVPDHLKRNNYKFIMIPRHNKLIIQNEIKKELKKIGGKKLLSEFIDNL